MGSRSELGGILCLLDLILAPNPYFPGVSPGSLLSELLYSGESGWI